jgi:hypothetical protein
LRVQTISASLFLETVAAWANRPLATMHVAMATLTIAVARAGGYPLASVAGDLDQNVAARIPKST